MSAEVQTETLQTVHLEKAHECPQTKVDAETAWQNWQQTRPQPTKVQLETQQTELLEQPQPTKANAEKAAGPQAKLRVKRPQPRWSRGGQGW